MPLRFSIRAPRRDYSTDCADAPVQDVEVADDADELIFGRAAAATVQLPFPKVSARHARLFRADGGFRVEDLGSSNGTRLGCRRIDPRVPEPIAIGETLEMGGVEVLFVGERTRSGTVAPAAGTETLARRLVHDIFEACPPAEHPRLVVLSGRDRGRELLLSASGRVCKLGRGEGCDWVLGDEEISREHATFERAATGITVRDLGSKNGVDVAGERVLGMRGLRDGDVVRVGETRLRLVDPEDRYLRQMEAADGEAAPAVVAGAPVEAASPTVGEPSLPERAVPAVTPVRRGRLPVVATAVAAAVLVGAGVVLALALAL